jgi:hypothetical protein
MAHVHAYHLPDDTFNAAVDQSDLQHVSVDKLHSVGWKITFVRGGHDQIVQKCEKMAKESGYPVSEEGCKVPFKLDLDKHADALHPEVSIVLILSQRAFTHSTDFRWLS